jgi:hypothetical protein
MPRGGTRPNVGRKPVPDGHDIRLKLPQTTIDLLKAEAKRYGLPPGAMVNKILCEELRGR